MIQRNNDFQVLTGGEDAYFIASQNWLGVADGVGQWALEGTNPGVYAQELMDNCEQIVSDGNGSLPTSPVEVLRSSVAKSHSHGLSTVLLAHFDGQVQYHLTTFRNFSVANMFTDLPHDNDSFGWLSNISMLMFEGT